MFDWFYTLRDKFEYIFADETTRDWIKRERAESEDEILEQQKQEKQKKEQERSRKKYIQRRKELFRVAKRAHKKEDSHKTRYTLKKLSDARTEYETGTISLYNDFLKGITPLFPDTKTPFQVAEDDKRKEKRKKCILKAMKRIRKQYGNAL